MIILGDLTGGLSRPEQLAGLLGVAAICGYAIWAFARWFFGGSVRPDPWDDQVTQEVAEEEATPLCHRCLTPHHRLANFCPSCGAPVGRRTTSVLGIFLI
jgi:hypothetical protein